MRHLDLFSGIGGFALAAERVGWKTVGFCEINTYCQKVLRKHWPDVPIHKNIKDFDGVSADIITGGFPCKQTSLAAAIHGNRCGLDGKDSGLWWEYLRLVQAVRPVWVVVENPPGVNQWAGEIQTGLEGLGYRVSRLEWSSRDCGASHRRRRVFFVANSNGTRLSLTRENKPHSATNVTWASFTGRIRDESNARVLRVDDGISARVERITAIGNSVDPRVAEVIFRTIATVARQQ